MEENPRRPEGSRKYDTREIRENVKHLCSKKYSWFEYAHSFAEFVWVHTWGWYWNSEKYKHWQLARKFVEEHKIREKQKLAKILDGDS